MLLYSIIIFCTSAEEELIGSLITAEQTTGTQPPLFILYLNELNQTQKVTMESNRNKNAIDDYHQLISNQGSLLDDDDDYDDDNGGRDDNDNDNDNVAENGNQNEVIDVEKYQVVEDDEEEEEVESLPLEKSNNIDNEIQEQIRNEREESTFHHRLVEEEKEQTTSQTINILDDKNHENEKVIETTISNSNSVSNNNSNNATTKSLSKITKLLDCGGGANCTRETLREFIHVTTPRLIKHDNDDKEMSNANHDDNHEKVTNNEDEENENDTPQEEEEHDLMEPMPFSDLSDPTRNIWIVTTAALPWRTGTAINPFLRALYLVRRRLRCRLDLPLEEETGKVTLVIPWLTDPLQATKLFGSSSSLDIISTNKQEGQTQQLAWMEEYAKTKCNMEKEMNHLHILFYDASYWPAFGSIFPSVDICSLIPNEEADVAILEEPEHLNWFRMPPSNPPPPPLSSTVRQASSSSPLSSASILATSLVKQIDKNESGSNDERNESGCNDNDNETTNNANEKAEDSKNNNNDENTTKDSHESTYTEDDNNNKNIEHDENNVQRQNELGWARKFNFVVGIIHTNYNAYIKQYGIGTSIIGAPALSAMSTMVVRAYCHRVVKLSAVIPSYAKWKEITCNVHGVRGDFLGEKIEHDDNETIKLQDNYGGGNEDKVVEQQYAPIYFIGKLLWAKGFDRMLKVQNLFRDSNPHREYFPIDVYGDGPDATAICRAFHGRIPHSSMSRPSSPTKQQQQQHLNEQRNDMSINDGQVKCTSEAVLFQQNSIKKQLFDLVKSKEGNDMHKAYNAATRYINMGFEVVAPPGDDNDSNHLSQDDDVMKPKVLVSDQDETDTGTDPISILSDITEKAAFTSVATTEAVINLADSAVKAGIAVTFSEEQVESLSEDDELKRQASLIFDPPKSLFELRRHPIPARFLGVKDHALLRNSPHKIFLNPSVTEVLCTTTAEALAMGKFVIIPDHPSNVFFLQFPNCLTYKNLRDCVEKLNWALQNEPEPLTEQQSHIFTWEAATDRLIEASLITKQEEKARIKHGYDKADKRMAWLHSEGGKKGQFIKSLFGKVESKRQQIQDVMEKPTS